MKKTFVFLGCYGSGKSELAINLALRRTGKGPCTLVDLDLVNPFFRSSERGELLRGAGIRLISPPFALQRAEMVNLSAEIFSAFAENEGTAVFDVGGDAAGSVALGRYHAYFERIAPECLEVLFVVNPCRPLCDTAERAAEMMETVQSSGRVRITGLVNNANLADETTPDELFLGYETVRQISDMTGCPVRATAAIDPVLGDFLKRGELDRAYLGETVPLQIHMHRTWGKFVRDGV